MALSALRYSAGLSPQAASISGTLSGALSAYFVKTAI